MRGTNCLVDCIIKNDRSGFLLDTLFRVAEERIFQEDMVDDDKTILMEKVICHLSSQVMNTGGLTILLDFIRKIKNEETLSHFLLGFIEKCHVYQENIDANGGGSCFKNKMELLDFVVKSIELLPKEEERCIQLETLLNAYFLVWLASHHAGKDDAWTKMNEIADQLDSIKLDY